MAAPRLEMGTSTPATGNFAGTTTAMAFTVIEDQGQAIASQHLLETSGWGFVAQIVRGGGRKMQDSGAWMWHGQHAFELRRVRAQILIEGSVEVRGELRVPPTPGAPVWRLLLDSGAEVHVVDKAQAAMYLNPLTGRGPNLRGVGDCHKISVARASLVLTANPGMSQGRSDKGRVLSGPLELPNPCFALHPLAPEAAGAHVVKLIDTVRVTANKGGKGYVEDLTAHERILDLATKAGDRGAPTRAPTTAECEAMWTAWLSEGASISATDAAHWTEARAPTEASPLQVLAAADSGASTGAGHSAGRGGGQGSRRDKDGRSGGGGELPVGREWFLDACPPLSPDRLIDPGDAVPLLMVEGKSKLPKVYFARDKSHASFVRLLVWLEAAVLHDHPDAAPLVIRTDGDLMWTDAQGETPREILDYLASTAKPTKIIRSPPGNQQQNPFESHAGRIMYCAKANMFRHNLGRPFGADMLRGAVAQLEAHLVKVEGEGKKSELKTSYEAYYGSPYDASLWVAAPGQYLLCREEMTGSNSSFTPRLQPAVFVRPHGAGWQVRLVGADKRILKVTRHLYVLNDPNLLPTRLAMSDDHGGPPGKLGLFYQRMRDLYGQTPRRPMDQTFVVTEPLSKAPLAIVAALNDEGEPVFADERCTVTVGGGEAWGDQRKAEAGPSPNERAPGKLKKGAVGAQQAHAPAAAPKAAPRVAPALLDDDELISFDQSHRKQHASRTRYERYKHAKTIGELKRLNPKKWRDDLKWDLAKAIAWLPRQAPTTPKVLVLQEQPPKSEPRRIHDIDYLTRQALVMPKVLALWEPPQNSELHYESSLATAASEAGEPFRRWADSHTRVSLARVAASSHHGRGGQGRLAALATLKAFGSMVAAAEAPAASRAPARVLAAGTVPAAEAHGEAEMERLEQLEGPLTNLSEELTAIERDLQAVMDQALSTDVPHFAEGCGLVGHSDVYAATGDAGGAPSKIQSVKARCSIRRGTYLGAGEKPWPRTSSASSRRRSQGATSRRSRTSRRACTSSSAGVSGQPKCSSSTSSSCAA